jgi:hypothetical protein
MAPKLKKSRITYDMWLKLYKAKDVNTITLEEHTKYSKLYANWRTGNIEKVY